MKILLIKVAVLATLLFIVSKLYIDAKEREGKLKVELQYYQENLTRIINEHNNLRRKCELSKEKVKKIIQKQPVMRVIYVPQVENECEAMKEMVDQVVKIYE